MDLDEDARIFQTPCEPPPGLVSTSIDINRDDDDDDRVNDDDGVEATWNKPPGLGSIPSEPRLSAPLIGIDLVNDNGSMRLLASLLDSARIVSLF